MIVTGKHLPPPHLPEGHGRRRRAADARRDDAGVRRRRPTREGAAAPGASPTCPNGITMDDWTPKAAGAAFEYTRVMKPLETFRADTRRAVRAWRSRTATRSATVPAITRAPAPSYLTGVHPRKTAGADIQNGISVDQIAAQQIGSQTRFGSLELGCDDSRTVGNCDSGYSCAYTNSLAWRGPATPMPPETNPRLVFERLFGDIDTSLPPDVRARRLRYRRSILDLVGERTARALGRSRAGRQAQARRVPVVDPRDRAAHRARREAT